ncbi:mitochondrial fission ELM1 family protein [Luteolibacter yonseiensis]|uniref:Mitochondrial fission ELM1 family protein n=1 Tax=Luteolibacter yonseiensis TaxID=1144680 RepID=A0A934R108_9BACT|nr:ELM1/GtrOC1 family putative glycosyltransferase [Luteolibacter yonseiensis]MBK1814916.1 mitochondrial fission ELM1 family protein [Luteolibacter yonseiensis]
MKESLTIWMLGDGKPGHENQSLGLIDAIGRIVPCSVHRISLAGSRGLFTRVGTAVATSAGFPKPDLIVSAGHSTHLSLLWLARKHDASSIVLMRPSLPMGWFDLCIIPEHDLPDGSSRSNVILTRGALNRVALPEKTARGGKMLLIGGPSASHGWDGEQLVSALAEISTHGTWQLTDSRRTPEGFLKEVRERLPAIEIFPHTETSPDWLPQKLAAADEVWVTEDSVSMIYEALSSGGRVGLLPMPVTRPDSRVLKGIGMLVAGKFLTTFAGWRTSRQLDSPPSVLREADRCARRVVSYLSS